MIFGAIFPSVPSNWSIQKLDLLKSLMHCPDFSFHLIKHKYFTGGVFLHPNIPKSINDYYYFDEKNDVLVLFSGEVFNLINLSSKEEKQVSPKLIASLFMEKGASFTTYLNGDFSIFIYQPRRKRFFLFRDHLGIQPMAYTPLKTGFFFSGDILNLCKVFSKNEKINFDFLLSNYKITNHLETPNSLVKKLRPGHYLEGNSEQYSEIKYWFPEKIKEEKNLNYKKVLEEINHLVHDAVKIRSNPKFFAGAHLSGGLDSSLVASLARENYSLQGTFLGFSYSPDQFEIKEYDERKFVNAVALRSKILPRFNSASISDYYKYISNHFDVLGYFYEEKVRNLAEENNVNLIFSGWGGDEFLSASDAGINLDLFLKFHWILFFRRNPINNPKKLFKIFLFKIIFPILGLIKPGSKKAHRESVRYLKKSHSINNKKVFKLIYQYHSRRKRQLGYIYYYHLAERCELWSIQGFKHGIVYRYPLLDIRIIEYILKIPSNLLVNGTLNRVLIRDICKGVLPEFVRLNNSKLDYLLFENNWELIKCISSKFVNEIDTWRLNPDLELIDFDLLEKDLSKYYQNQNPEKFNNLIQNIVFIKSLHEFTKTYRSLPPE